MMHALIAGERGAVHACEYIYLRVRNARLWYELQFYVRYMRPRGSWRRAARVSAVEKKARFSERATLAARLVSLWSVCCNLAEGSASFG